MDLAIILVILVILICLYLYSKYYNESKWSDFYKLSGPAGIPILGNVQLFYNPEELFKIDSQRCKEYYPIFREEFFYKIRFVNIVNPEDTEIILTNIKHHSKSSAYEILHKWLGTGLLTSEGKKWHERRKLLTPAFHFNILQKYVHIFNKETKNFVAHLKTFTDETYVDVLGPVSDYTLTTIKETAMGTDADIDETDKNYKNTIHELGGILIQRLLKPWLFNDTIYSFTSKSKKEHNFVKILHGFSTKIINEKRLKLENNEVDILSAAESFSRKKKLSMLELLLISQKNGADIDDDGIREEVDTFMFEGHDTTAAAISLTFMMLANHSEIQEKIYEEIITVLGTNESPSYNDLNDLKYMEMCIKECLRLYPSVPFISRKAGEDFRTSAGLHIPKGCLLNLHIYDMHRNPNVFPDPEKFDPDRFLPENCQGRHPFAYIPFSAGSRNCIGQRFAMLEIKSVLCGVLRHLVLLPVDGPEDIRFKTDLVLRVSGSIRVKFALRDKKPLLHGQKKYVYY